MPYKCTVEVEQRIALAQFYGSVTVEDVAAVRRSVFLDPQWEPSFDIVFDARFITKLLFFPEDLEIISCEIQEVSPGQDGGKTVVVVSREVDHMVAVVLVKRQQEVTKREARVFSGLEEARRWLGRDRADLGWLYEEKPVINE